MQLFLEAVADLAAVVGLLLGTGGAWLCAVLFLSLCLSSVLGLRRPRLAFAFGALGTGLAALSAWHVASRSDGGLELLARNPWLETFAGQIYLTGRLAFAALVLTESRLLTRGGMPRGASFGLWSAVAGSLLAGLLLSPSMPGLIALQTPLVTICFVVTAWLFWAQPQRERGARLTACAAFASALVWTLWGLGFPASAGSHPDPGPWPGGLGSWASVDLVLIVPLAMGFLLVLVGRERNRRDAIEAERARLERRVAGLERIESFGLLVSGIAHELNNPLTAVLGFAEDLEARLLGDDARAAKVIREQAQRCRSIVDRLGVLTGTSQPRLEPVDMVALVQRALRGLVPMAREAGSKVELELQPPLSLLEADPARIEQLVVNLVANAIQASPPGGTVRVRVEVDVEALALTVEDDGPGVPEQLRSAITRPFFTTRAESGGTGIGLALVAETLRQVGGELIVGSRADGAPGASFVARFPLLAAVLGGPGKPEVVLLPRAYGPRLLAATVDARQGSRPSSSATASIASAIVSSSPAETQAGGRA